MVVYLQHHHWTQSPKMNCFSISVRILTDHALPFPQLTRTLPQKSHHGISLYFLSFFLSFFYFFIVINFFFYYYLFIYLFFTLQYCIGFAIQQHASATGVHVFPILNPPPTPSPYQPIESSQCTSPKLPVFCIEPGLAIHFLCDIIHVLMPFSQIISPPSPPESKRLFYASVSLLLSCIQGCRSYIESYLYQSCLHFTLTLPMKIILNHDLQNIIF